ncbi:hypothetical protein ACY46K_005263 [Escherichia coli]
MLDFFVCCLLKTLLHGESPLCGGAISKKEYGVIADSGADTEFTGRHPAPCFATKVLFLFFSNYHRYPFIFGCAWRGLFFTTSHWQMVIL